MAMHFFRRGWGQGSGNARPVGPGRARTPAEWSWPELAWHFWVHIWASFNRNKCFVRASALSFSSLLGLIPMLAVVLSVTSSLLQSQDEDRIYAAINQLVNSVVPPATVAPGAAEAGGTNGESVASVATVNNVSGVTNVTNVASVARVDGEGGAAGTNYIGRAGGPVAAVRVSAQREVARHIFEFVHNLRRTTLGVTGILLLVWAAIAMLAEVESSFNEIWGVERDRQWLAQVVLYWTTLTLGPLLLAGAASLAASAHSAAAHGWISHAPLVAGLIFDWVPMGMVWLGFTLVYVWVPNTRVTWTAAVAGGIAGGSLWQLNNTCGYLYVSQVVANNLIYGSLGLVPVLMAGIYVSWVMVLFGAQVAYAVQNRMVFLTEKMSKPVNQRGREFIALRLLTALGLRYHTGQPPATLPQIATELGVSIRLTRQILQTLLPARLVTEVAGAEPAFIPARPLADINAHQVLLAVRSAPLVAGCPPAEPVSDEIYGEFARIEEAERVAAAQVTMQALVDRAQAKRRRPALPSETLEPIPPAAAVPAQPLISPEPLVVELTVDPLPEPVPPPPPQRTMAVPEEDRGFPL